MKRLLALLLALALCFGLAACASEDEKALEEAHALMEDGEYEEALDLLYSIELYQQVSALIHDARQELLKEELGFLEGTWKDLYSTVELTFDDEGKYVFRDGYGSSWDGEAFYDDEEVLWIIDETEIKKVDGRTHILTGDYDLVSEDDYAEIGPREIEITMDNWETYFELREAIHCHDNDFGEITSVSPGYGIFLKDEYVDKIPYEYYTPEISFKYNCTYSYYYCDITYDPLTVTMKNSKPRYLDDEDAEGEVTSLREYDPEYTAEQSQFCGYYAAEITSYSGEIDGKLYTRSIENLEIIGVVGSITLFP